MGAPARRGSGDAVRRRPGGRTARVTRAILDAAVEEVMAAGYDGFTFDGVAERAGVHRTSVYRRWPDKTALLVDALRHQPRGPRGRSGCALHRCQGGVIGVMNRRAGAV